MKKEYKTFIHESVKNNKEIVVSAGKIGLQIVLDTDDLEKALDFEYCDVIK